VVDGKSAPVGGLACARPLRHPRIELLGSPALCARIGHPDKRVQSHEHKITFIVATPVSAASSRPAIQWITDHLPQVQRLVDRRDDLCQNPLFVLRRLLKAIGLKLDRRQVMRAGERFMVYGLDADHRDRWLGYVRARLAHLAAQAAITTNAEEEFSFRDRSNAEEDPPPFDLAMLEDLGALDRGDLKRPPAAPESGGELPTVKHQIIASSCSRGECGLPMLVVWP
jgi:hypothetical protein